MAGMVPDFPTPIYLCQNVSGTGLQPNILDITDAISAGLPVVIEIVISATATVQILGAVEVNANAGPPGTLVDAVDVTGGGFTVTDFYDLVLGLPLYQVNITANTGTVTVKTARGSLAPGQVGKVHLLRFTSNAPQGT